MRRQWSRNTTSMIALSFGVRTVVSVPKDLRDKLTKSLSSVREETKGQVLDLSDMADAARNVSRGLQDTVKSATVTDEQFKGKVNTLAASLKAYNTRLNNLQNEGRSIQSEVDALMKLLWGSEQGGAPASSDAAPSKKEATDFEVDVPPIAQRLEKINEEVKPDAPKQTTTTTSEAPTKKKATVEVVEGEVVREATKSSSSTPQEEETATEIEVESIEVDVQENATSSTSSSSSSSKASPTTPTESVADTMSITDITKELYERGVNFADCLDAKSLRQRYRDVLEGRAGFATNQRTAGHGSAPPRTEQRTATQPPPPPRPQHQQQQQQSYQQPPPNTTETGLAHDPHPNAYRKMIDPMKYVWEIKQELAAEKGIDPKSVDLWSGRNKLEEHKRLYDYPSIQSYPIEVRQKGDVPR